MILLGLGQQAAAQAQVWALRSSNFEYEPNGVLRKEIVEAGDADLCVATTYLRDDWGNKRQATTANCPNAGADARFSDRVSTLVYAAASVTFKTDTSDQTLTLQAGQFATTARNAKGQSETRLYDPRTGAVVSVKGPNGLTTRWEYDDFGRKTKELRADGTSTLWSYCILPDPAREVDRTSNTPGSACNTWLTNSSEAADAISFVQIETKDANGDPMGPTSRVYQDRQGRTIRELSQGFDAGQQAQNQRFVAKDTFYDTHGVAYLVTAPYFVGTNLTAVGATRTTVDALGRITKVEVVDESGSESADLGQGLGSNRVVAVTRIEYHGPKSITTNPKGQKRTEEKNADGKVVRVEDEYSAQLAHRYDPFGNLVETRDALQHTITLSYDARGRKTGMSDPDTGEWKYAYNAVGELIRQQSPKQIAASTPDTKVATTMKYDELGRMTERVDPAEYVSIWIYDSCANGIGKLCESNADHGVNKKLAYDDRGRPIGSRTTISNGPSFATALEYESHTSRVKTQTYPTGVKVNYLYSPAGFLRQVELGTNVTISPLPATPGGAPVAGKELVAGKDSAVLWTAGTVNAWGKLESYTLNNGITSIAQVAPLTGRLKNLIAAGPLGIPLNLNYTWDSLNNLRERKDYNGDGTTGEVQESFDYDSINRMTSYTVEAPQVPNLRRTVELHYNAAGSLLYKSDVGNYHYPQAGSPRPHAVGRIVGSSSFGTVDYQYDDNGNMYAASGGKYRSIAYNSFNLPKTMAGPAGTPSYAWMYDENHQRIKEMRTTAAGTRVTWYLHPDNQGGLAFESEQSPSGTVSNRHYISAGGQTIVLVSTGALNQPPTQFVKLEYWHKDHLGSVVATTDHLGKVTARYAYDPYGKRRMTNGSYDEQGNLVVDWADNVNAGTDRGYTGHEHLDDIGVVHMNGRIFDPTIARFMQADPFIQAPLELQSYDRFAYCFGNPGGCTDPSGYFSLRSFIRNTFLGPIGDYRNARMVANTQYGYMGGQIAIGVVSSVFCNWAAYICNGVGQAVWAGFAGQSFESAFKVGIVSAATTYAFQQIGTASQQQNWGWGARVGAHAAVGCMSAAASGGDCRSGAVAGAVGKAASLAGPDWLQNPEGWEQVTAGAAYEAVVGGTASALGGGKFANGAVTAAFGYLFNQALSGVGRAAVAGNGLRASAASCSSVELICSSSANASLAARLDQAADGLGSQILQIAVAGASVSPLGLIHGNSWLNPKPTSVYQLISNATGEVMKYGITNEVNPQDRYTPAFYKAANVTMDVIYTFESRPPARIMEILLCTGHVVQYGELPKLSSRC